MSLGEGQAVYGNLGKIVVHRNSIVGGVVIGGAVRNFGEQAPRLLNQKGQEIVGSDQVGVNGEPKYAKTSLEVVLPYRLVPVRRPSLKHFRSPDVVDEHVYVSVVVLNLLGQFF